MNPFAHLTAPKLVLPIDYDSSSPSIKRMAREQYEELQGGLCYYCKKPLGGPPSPKVQNTSINEDLFPPNFFKHPIHLHHDHISGQSLGAAHARCNAYMWQINGE